MRTQLVRRSAAVVAGVALAVGAVGVVSAVEANATPDSTTRITSVGAGSAAAAKSISIKSDHTTAKAWAKVSLPGKTTGIAANTTVQVQRLQSGKWVNFPATTKVTSKSTYSVWVKSGRVGVNKFRVVSANTASAAVAVTITK
jgi:hypothetical protein